MAAGAAENAVVRRATANGWDVQQQMLFEIMVSSASGTGLNQEEVYEVFNGTSPEGKAISLFETKSGTFTSLANLLISDGDSVSAGNLLSEIMGGTNNLPAILTATEDAALYIQAVYSQIEDNTLSNSAVKLNSGQSVFKDVLDNSYLALIRASLDDIYTSINLGNGVLDDILTNALAQTGILNDISTESQNANTNLLSILDQQPFEHYADLAGSKTLTTKTLLRAGLTYMTGGNIYNPNATTIFIKFYDSSTTAGVNVGTTPVDYMLPIPALSSVILENTSCPKKKFVNGIVMVAGTTYDDADVSNPAIGAYVSVINYNNVVI